MAPLLTSAPAPSPELLAQQRQQALAAAELCIHVLKQEFGATQVIIFGSLRGDAPWHGQSDLDLAVQGLSAEAIWQAYGKLESIVPPWLRLDLVDVDQMPERVRDRILHPIPMTDHPYLALKARIEDEVIALVPVIEGLQAALDQADTVPDIFVTPTLAGYIVDFYTGCERIGERVAVTLDGGLPQGDRWHEQLLRQLSDAGGEHRPPLWQGSLLLDLDEYRKFRHIVRHRYNAHLQRDRVLELAQRVPPVFDKLQSAIAQFNHWLDQQINTI